MHQPRSKFRKRAELTAIYALMTFAVITLVAILVMVMQGYRFNKFDGKVEQGGLLQYDSRPTGGTVLLDGITLANHTPNKITVTAGSHTVTMTKPGYIDWQKQVNIQPGGILWLNYTRFIPKNHSLIPVIPLSAVSDAAISRDQKTAVIKTDPSTPEVSLVALDTDTPAAAPIAFSPDMLTPAADVATQTFRFGAWDRDSRYILVAHGYDGNTEWLVLDTHDKKIVNNITRELGVAAIDLQFSYDNNRQLYVLTDQHELRRIDLGSRTMTGPLLSNIEEFAQYDRSTVFYTTLLDEAQKKRSVGYLTSGASAPKVLQSYADDGATPLHVSIGKYFNETYVLLAYGETLDIMSGDLPASDTKNASALTRLAVVSVPGGIRYIGFSPEENRHVYAQNDTSVVTYDLELKKPSTISLAYPQPKRIQWVDPYHFVNTAQSQLKLYEFDGANTVDLATGVADLPVAISPNNKYLYAFSATPQPAVSRMALVVD